MSRSVPWRRVCSDVVHWRQLQAIQARIYVLQENGPTAFTVKEHDSTRKLRVTLGDPSACTCTTYMKEHELCIHILWVVLKLFKIPAENPISWQGSLVEREIQQIVKSRESTRAQAQRNSNSDTSSSKTAAANQNNENVIEPRPIEEGDCCPICQDQMTRSQHLTYCRYSCGHSIHSRCMKIWADHQLSQGTSILCPMCRAEFGTLKMIMTDHLKETAFRRDLHPGTTCSNCSSSPIQGKHYMCTICEHYSLCMQCFAGPNHTQHPFQFKEKPAHRWRAAVRDLSSIAPTLAAELENRDITENDYETLLALDEGQANTAPGLSTKELDNLKCIMLTKNSSLLKQRDLHCHICLAGFTISQHVVELPCSHKFHKVCADNWLSHTHDYCPTCTEPVVVNLPQRKRTSLVRYNQKEVIREQPPVEFSLAGSMLCSAAGRALSSGSVDSLQSSGSSSAALDPELSVRNINDILDANCATNKTAIRGRRAGPSKTRLPSLLSRELAPTLSLTLGTPPTAETSQKASMSRKPPVTKPPRLPRAKRSENPVIDLDLRIGSGGSPVDIIKRISSVHDKPVSRSPNKEMRPPRRAQRGNNRSRSPSVGRDIQPELVVVSGTKI